MTKDTAVPFTDKLYNSLVESPFCCCFKTIGQQRLNTKLIILTQSKGYMFPINNYVCKPVGTNFTKTTIGFLLFRLYKTKVCIPKG